jgi:hypothetical protein
MTTTLTGVKNAALNVQLTGPSELEDADAADVNVPFQKVLDNTYKIACYVLADFTELKALTTMIAGERFYVQGYGYYEWRASSTSTEDLPRVVDPTVAGDGRFHLVASELFAGPRMVRRDVLSATPADSTAAVWTDIAGTSTTLAITGGSPVKVGDLVTVEVAAKFANTGAGGSELRAVIVDGNGTPSNGLGSEQVDVTTRSVPLQHSLVLTSVTAAPIVKLQCQATADHTNFGWLKYIVTVTRTGS